MVQGSGLVIGQDYRGACRFGGQLPVKGGSQLMSNFDTPDFYGVRFDEYVVGISTQFSTRNVTPTPESHKQGKGPGTDCWRQGEGSVVPVQKWSCLEWLFDGSAPAGVGMQFWLDGAGIDALTIAGGKADACVHQEAGYVLPSPDFGARLDIGWESYNADAKPRTLWVDDVKLGTERVGCP